MRVRQRSGPRRYKSISRTTRVGKICVHGSRKVTSETPPLFGKTRFLQGLIDEFIDKITEGTIYMEMGVKAYLEADKAQPPVRRS